MLEIRKISPTEDPNYTEVTVILRFPRRDLRVMRMRCTVDRFRTGLARTYQGEPVQNAFPFLGPDEREFLITGMSAAEWAEMFPEGEKE